jgi:copper chaperone CopZ
MLQMRRIVVDVPEMYGDHHVTRVREALLGAKGVSEVIASSARRKVAVVFDEAVTTPEALRDALVTAGYLFETPAPIEVTPRHKDGSSWYVIADRVTKTEIKDREMAGDFRRY